MLFDSETNGTKDRKISDRRLQRRKHSSIEPFILTETSCNIANIEYKRLCFVSLLMTLFCQSLGAFVRTYAVLVTTPGLHLLA